MPSGAVLHPEPLRSSATKPSCCAGLFRRYECWLPSPKGWFALAGFLCFLFLVATKTIYPFLAVDNPYPDGPLVVEGWMEGKSFPIISAEFQRHGSPVVFTTGGPIERSSMLGDYHTFAELGAASLKRLGFPPESIQPVPAAAAVRDRTYSSAVALHTWMTEHQAIPAHLTVLTSGAHARRTRLLFQKAFGDATKIGVIAVADEAFDPARWWTSSEGFRNVTGELIAYVYARLLFWPSPP
jgi:hypothetical protein